MRFDIRRCDETESTNDDAKGAAEDGAAPGTVFWALRQRAGRGRQGRVWLSPEGNLYFSVILRPASGVTNYGFYSFIAALAVHDAVRFFLPDALIELKWPNDVLVGGKKISGILLEAGAGYLVVGIGLNVQALPENPLFPATCLNSEGADVSELDKVLTHCLGALSHWDEVFGSIGFEPLRAAWRERARKGPMRVRSLQDDITGDFIDLDVEGSLRLRLPDGTERYFRSGDVFF